MTPPAAFPVSVDVKHESSEEIQVILRNKGPCDKLFLFMISDPDEFSIVPSSGRIQNVAEISLKRLTEKYWTTKLLLKIRLAKEGEGAGDFWRGRDEEFMEYNYPFLLEFRKNATWKSWWPVVFSGLIVAIGCSAQAYFWLFSSQEEITEEKDEDFCLMNP